MAAGRGLDDLLDMKKLDPSSIFRFVIKWASAGFDTEPTKLKTHK
jgi:hypothetical protein